MNTFPVETIGNGVAFVCAALMAMWLGARWLYERPRPRSLPVFTLLAAGCAMTFAGMGMASGARWAAGGTLTPREAFLIRMLLDGGALPGLVAFALWWRRK